MIMTLIAALGAAVLLPDAGHPVAAAEPCGVIITAPAEVAPGTGFTVSVDVAGVAALDAGQFDVSFDESLLHLEEVTAGEVGAVPIPVDLWSRVGTGTYRVIVNVPGVPGVSGSGSLAILHFQAASSAAGSLTLTPSNGFLNTNLGTEILTTWTGVTINVADSPGAPGPSGTDDPADTTVETAASRGTPAWAWWLIGIGVVAAAGGTALFTRHSRGAPR